MKKAFLIVIGSVLLSLAAAAQACNTIVSSFPYQEGFESSMGGWSPYGTSSDWAWGTPNKAVITGAAEGIKCWNTGGFQATGYTNGENAWLLSPCFDFSSLTNPEISFKVIWETEQRYDGANLQYTLDNGNSWTLIGDLQSGNSCISTNWYNTSSVTFLGNVKGWSGNIQPTQGSCLGGNGSGGWLDAKHTLSFLAGRPSVRFRFLFGAGTTCNGYDGFGIDDIRIAETPPAAGTVSIESTCINTNTLSFTVTGSCMQSYAWNFGDPASGAQNSSSSIQPTHTFSAPGVYTVSATVTNAVNQTTTVTKEVVVIGAQKQIDWPGACSNLPNATLTVTPTGSNTPYIYSWTTDPPQTGPSVTNVGEGTYAVFIASQNACNLRVDFELVPSGTVNVSATVVNAACGSNNGSVSTTVSGGNGPYTYLWSNGASSPSISSLAPGNYSVTVTDANGCGKAAGPYSIVNENRTVAVNLGPDKNICPGQVITLSPGNFASYLWQDGSIASNLSVTNGGRYYVTVRDASGCTGSDTVSISSDCTDIYFPSAFTPNGDGINDLFGPLGNIYNAAQYTLHIYDRYANLVFSSSDPAKKWNGYYKNTLLQTGNYVWISRFTLNGNRQERKGSVLLIR
ncbi:MAG: gliding motility-associated C-terminal domain-containing protein [Ferruginibacter sp.]